MDILITSAIVGMVIAAIIGVGIGVLSGMLGVGGGTVMVPVFSLGFGMKAIQATGSSLFAIVFISISGCITHIRNKTCIIPVGIGAGLAGSLASPAGVYLASISPSWAIMLAAAVVICYSGYTMFRKALALPSRKEQAQRQEQAASVATAENGAGAGSEAAKATSGADGKAAESASKPSIGVKTLPDTPQSYRKERFWLCIPIGLIAGLCSGYVGVGGGFIMVPLFLSLLAVPMRYASGTSLMAILILAIPGSITQLMMGNVDLGISIATMVGAIPGAVLGANLSKKVPERELRFIFAFMLVVSAILLVVKEIGLAGV